MELDDLLYRYFGSRDHEAIKPKAAEAGLERMRVDFGLENDRSKRFALWCLLHMLGEAPDLEVAFKGAADQKAARNFRDLLRSAGGD